MKHIEKAIHQVKGKRKRFLCYGIPCLISFSAGIILSVLQYYIFVLITLVVVIALLFPAIKSQILFLNSKLNLLDLLLGHMSWEDAERVVKNVVLHNASHKELSKK